MNGGNKKIELTVSDTQVLKGIALVLLLIHHLFFLDRGLYHDCYIGTVPIVQTLGLVSKVCVAIFVFLSGYGLVKSCERNLSFSIVQFYKKRLSNLYMNYWFIYLLFVPFLYFFFHTDVYPSFLYFCIDFLGLARCFQTPTYNATWWFYSCILPLYIIFPLLRYLLDKGLWFLLVVISEVFLLKGPFVSYLAPIQYYLLPFVVGMVFAKLQVLSVLAKYRYLASSFLWGILLIFSILWRQFGFKIKDVCVDTVIVVLGVILFSMIKNRMKVDNRALMFLGKHSFNIFLFHTFLIDYFRPYVYCSMNPFISFMILLLMSSVVSIIIESLKHHLLFYRVQNGIIK